MRIGIFLLSVLSVHCLAAELPYKPSERAVRIAGNRRSVKITEDKPVVFPDDEDDSQISTESVPDRLLILMQKIESVDDVLNFLGVQNSYSAAPVNGSEEEGLNISGSDGNETSDGITNRRNGLAASIGKNIAQAAGCEIEMRAVELVKPDDPSIITWPMCTRLPRCAGCCTSSLLECVPTKVSKSDIQVLQARYKGKSNGQFEVLGMKSLKVEKHEKCQCQCKEKASDCTSLQSYKPEECRCVCTNNLLRKKCNDVEHIWDSRDCQCKCKELGECSTGFFYSMENCRCEVLVASRIGTRRRIPVSMATTVSRQSRPAPLGDFSRPLAHLNGGERSKLSSVNIKPYDNEPFTLAQTRKTNGGRPIVKTDEQSPRG